eukprot:8616150-Pyramimonas_sp.AAC.1
MADASYYATIAQRRDGDSSLLVDLQKLGHGINATQCEGCRLGDGYFAGTAEIASTSSKEYALTFALHDRVAR